MSTELIFPPRNSGEITETRPTDLRFGDDEALRLWVSIFDHKSPATARHYRTQSGKFRLFLRLLHPEWSANCHLQMARESDVAMYEQALGLKAGRNGVRPNLRLSPDELSLHGLQDQPFETALKQSSINQALSVLNAMYEFFRTPNGVMVEPYVTVNPVKRVRKSSTRTVTQTDRHIPLEGIQAMNSYALSAIEQAKMTGDTAAVLNYERKLWIFTLLFGLWGRRDEVSKLSMGDFRQLYDQEWKATLQRKGGKIEEIPVAKWVITALRRYRASLGLPAAWQAGDMTPAVTGVRQVATKGRQISTQHVNAQTLYVQVRLLACETADEIGLGRLLPDLEQEQREMLIERLKRCSPHWFRHTGPTIAINSGAMSVENASKMLGHSSLATTTQMYYHADDKKTRAGLDSLGDTLYSKTVNPR